MKLPLSLSTISRRTEASPIGEMMQRTLANPSLISLAAGFVDNATLPVDLSAHALKELLGDRALGQKTLQYGSNQGNTTLRTLIARHLEKDEGVAEGTYEDVPARMVLTQGSQQMLYILSEILLDPGDIVLVEAPTYFVYLDVLKTRGARVVGIECDAGGMKLGALEETLASIEARGELDRVKLIYVISEHNNPTGLSLAGDRRAGLVEIAQRWSRSSRILILEDSAYRGLCFDGIEPASVWARDPEGQTVILCRTFSKTLSPGLRCGYTVLPADLVAPVLAIKGSHDFGSAHFVQALLAQIMADGSYAKHVAMLRGAYRIKRDALLTGLDESFGGFQDLVQWTKPKGGIYVWITLPSEVETVRGSAFFERCLAEGVLYVPGDLAFPAEVCSSPRNHARLTFGVPTVRELMEGTRRMAAALSDCLAVSV